MKASAAKSTCTCADAVRVIMPCVEPVTDEFGRNVVAAFAEDTLCNFDGLAVLLAGISISSPHNTTALLAGVRDFGVLHLVISGLAVLNNRSQHSLSGKQGTEHHSSKLVFAFQSTHPSSLLSSFSTLLERRVRRCPRRAWTKKESSGRSLRSVTIRGLEPLRGCVCLSACEYM